MCIRFAEIVATDRHWERNFAQWNIIQVHAERNPENIYVVKSSDRIDQLYHFAIVSVKEGEKKG